MNRRAVSRRAPRRGWPIVIAAIAAIPCVSAGIAVAADATASQDAAARGTTTQAATSGGGGTGGGGAGGAGSGSGSLKLKSENASPRKVFFYGERKATYSYSIAGSRPRNLKIQAVNKSTWKVARTWKRSRVKPGSVHRIRWSGTGRHRRPAPAGPYVFRVRTRHGATAERRHGADRSFSLFPYKFPLRAGHVYGDGYGAPRAGHVHQGQDILAPCGKRLVAARGGRIQYRGYQASGAGYYLVVDGKATGHDYVYMHLRRPGRPRQGQRVRTGQRIGTVGETGDASGCHLHFEMWTKPGWYEGGHAMPSVTRHLKYWDRWS
jgi:murein DD-endopeptidase MepM/ murein hydrolase activator NlpD